MLRLSTTQLAGSRVNLSRLAGFLDRRPKLRGTDDRRLRPLADASEVEVSLAIVGAQRMRSLNRTYRGQDRVTDVLSFSLEADGTLGEVVVCYPRAVQQAKQLGHSVRAEVERLAVHGLLHLLGYDHEADAEAEEMEALERQLLAALG